MVWLELKAKTTTKTWTHLKNEGNVLLLFQSLDRLKVTTVSQVNSRLAPGMPVLVPAWFVSILFSVPHEKWDEWPMEVACWCHHPGTQRSLIPTIQDVAVFPIFMFPYSPGCPRCFHRTNISFCYMCIIQTRKPFAFVSRCFYSTSLLTTATHTK
jgi:hypothetical protein